MPDAVAAAELDGRQLLVTANEGDGREYEGFEDETEVEDVTLASNFGAPDVIADLQEEENLGSLTVSTTDGVNAAGEHEALYSFGARSFSIWDAGTGEQVYDSGDDFEQITAASAPARSTPTTTTTSSTAAATTRARSRRVSPPARSTAAPTRSSGWSGSAGSWSTTSRDPEDPAFVQWLNNRDFSDPDVVGPDSGRRGCPSSTGPRRRPATRWSWCRTR